MIKTVKLKAIILLSLGFFSIFFTPSALAEESLNFTEFTLSQKPIDGHIYDLVTGIDNSFWGIGPDGIVKISLTGNVTKFDNLPISPYSPSQHQIVKGKDGNMWFPWLNSEGPIMVKMDSNGQSAEYPTDVVIPAYRDIVQGDGYDLLSTDTGTIGKFNTSSLLYNQILPQGVFLGSITAITYGLDGNIWFATDAWTGSSEELLQTNEISIYKMNSDGNTNQFSIPDLNSVSPNQIVTLTIGIDGNIWFADYYGGVVGKITPNGEITQYPIPQNQGNVCLPGDMLSGTDGNIWFDCEQTGDIMRAKLDGSLTRFPNSTSYKLRKGPDGNIWGITSETLVLITVKEIVTPPPYQGTVYVSLGDSFSSGEGAPNPDYLQGTDVQDNRCHRSTGAWPVVLNDIIQKNPWDTGLNFFTFRACSGAVTQDFTDKSKDKDAEPKQLHWLNEHTGLITFSIGGNNAGFGDVMRYCAMRLPNHPLCEQKYGGLVDAKIKILSSKYHNDDRTLSYIYNKVGEAAPNARIGVVGYPRFFPKTPPNQCSTAGAPVYFVKSDMLWMNKQVGKINAIIKQAVADQNTKEKSNRFIYVDVQEAFNGHELYTSNPFMNRGIIWWRKTIWNWSYHPNLEGNKKIAEIAADKLGFSYPQF